MNNIIFEKLVDFNVPILFIITSTPYDIREKTNNKMVESTRKNDRNKIKAVIHQFIKDAFIKRKKEKESEKFINEFVKIYFVNLVVNYSENPPVPVFGIDEVLSFFKTLVPKENWDNLRECCLKNNVERFEELCDKNFFLKSYSQFNIIREKNKIQAKKYLNDLKKGAFFTGLIPGVAIAAEYYYRNLFKEGLKFLYGFDYDEAELILEKDSKSNPQKKVQIYPEKTNPLLHAKDNQKNQIKDEIIKNNDKLEENIEDQIDKEVTNKRRNTFSVARGVVATIGEVGARFTVNLGLRAINTMFLPVCLFSALFSQNNVDNDCNKIIEIFEQAFTPLRFKTLISYIESFTKSIEYLDNRGKEIITEANKDEFN